MAIDIKWLEKHVLRRSLGASEQCAINSLEELNFNAYDTIIKNGDVAAGMFILRSGSIKILLKHEGTDIQLFEENEGAMFSKKSLLDAESKSTAEIVTTTSCTVYKLSHELFLDILHKHPNLAFMLLSAVIAYQQHEILKKNKQLMPLLKQIADKANRLPLVVKLIPIIFGTAYITAFFYLPLKDVFH